MAWFGGQKLRGQDLTLWHLVHALPLPLRMGKMGGGTAAAARRCSGLDTRAYGTVMGSARKGTEKEQRGEGRQQGPCVFASAR